MNGRSDFKVKLNRQAIAEITDKAKDSAHKMEIKALASEGAPPSDIYTTALLFSLQEYLLERHCTPDFELVLND